MWAEGVGPGCVFGILVNILFYKIGDAITRGDPRKCEHMGRRPNGRPHSGQRFDRPNRLYPQSMQRARRWAVTSIEPECLSHMTPERGFRPVGLPKRQQFFAYLVVALPLVGSPLPRSPNVEHVEKLIA